MQTSNLGALYERRGSLSPTIPLSSKHQADQLPRTKLDLNAASTRAAWSVTLTSSLNCRQKTWTPRSNHPATSSRWLSLSCQTTLSHCLSLRTWHPHPEVGLCRIVLMIYFGPSGFLQWIAGSTIASSDCRNREFVRMFRLKPLPSNVMTTN